MVQRRVVTAALAAAVLLVTTGCSSDDGEKTDAAGSPSPSSSSTGSSPPGRTAGEAPPAKGSVKVVRTVAEDLDTPWGLAPLPEGGLLVSSRDEATISRIDEKSGRRIELGEVPGVAPAGEGGLMGIAVSPEYASDHMIYAYFTSESDNRIVRMLYDPEKPAGEQLGAPDTILRGIPKGTNHNGGRLAFGPDRMLYASTGERYEGPLAQDKDSLGGKILRMTPEGQPAPGNPFDDSVVYSYGHRNVQGLAWDPEQRLWASEFGQNTWDELNHIRPGGNYGWPEVEGEGGESGYVDPVAVWSTEEASPSGIAIAEGSVWMAGLRGQRLWRVPLDGTETAAEPQAFLEGDYGRLRTVVAAGDDKLWLVTSETDGRGSPEEGDDKILELEVT
ncbi:PQQ-dependent sugar dehydrogenase [Streptomyces akebiae]|uniref:PQQ-dependent sugar dehydrogenase n=1 Tax=Streptomyces akebiae TaxID=2865673 RepID=A0ABX8XP17_9ACTN|nr:PQQ-dependent sugar dehydrogenase [Streptomyces akebiae]QYX77353.1 PQQ-dependent sugar dehydrogenase [Streptomyces akebiae]